ncbi:MAG: MarR family winged helix-turn-helix transcriptional regulator [Oscillospiraceae bacterium]|jgi:DNA-binding MarR family transcriptional regulator
MDYHALAVELFDIITLMQRRHLERQISALTEGEMATLGYLDRSGDGRTISELSQALTIGAPRVTAIVNSLVKKGFVTKRFGTRDRREIYVDITPEGRSYGRERYEATISRLQQTLEGLGEDDATEYVRLLKRVAEIRSKSGDDACC